MNKKVRLLAVDVDGTLVYRESGVSPENRAALAQAAAAGIRVCLCTGRSVLSSRRYLAELGLGGWHIFLDGGLVIHPETGDRLRGSGIEGALIEEMAAAAGELGIYIEVSSGLISFSAAEVAVPDFKRRYFDAEHRVTDLAGICGRRDIVQAELVATGPDADDRAMRFIHRFRDRLQVSHARLSSYPGVTFIIALAKGVSKGSALLALAGHLGIAPEETAAVGDWQNDVSMIGAAGLGIAMGNACEELKAIADHVTLGVEEHGLAAAIREVIL